MEYSSFGAERPHLNTLHWCEACSDEQGIKYGSIHFSLQKINSFFWNGIHKLSEKWEKITVKEDQYFEYSLIEIVTPNQKKS